MRTANTHSHLTQRERERDRMRETTRNINGERNRTNKKNNSNTSKNEEKKIYSKCIWKADLHMPKCTNTYETFLHTHTEKNAMMATNHIHTHSTHTYIQNYRSHNQKMVIILLIYFYQDCYFFERVCVCFSSPVIHYSIRRILYTPCFICLCVRVCACVFVAHFIHEKSTPFPLQFDG